MRLLPLESEYQRQHERADMGDVL